jgi:monoterpene epsilon-lactone hydrolase
LGYGGALRTLAGRATAARTVARVTRSPQVPVHLMRACVRGLVRPVLGPRMPVGLQRRWLELVTGPTPLPADVDVRPGRLGDRPAEVMVPRDGDSSRAVLYLHGGGFTIGSATTHRALATRLAGAIGATVHLLDYRLAPEHPFPAALDDVLAAWRELSAELDPGRIALAGDSAGGWLALTTALRLRDAGEPQPAVLGLVSPWLDLTGASWPADRSDPMLRPSWLHRCAAGFAPGADLTAPELAPLAADLSGLPPMVVHVGSEEILLADSIDLARRARAAGVAVELRRLDGLWHVAHASAGIVAASTAGVAALGEAMAARLALAG